MTWIYKIHIKIGNTCDLASHQKNVKKSGLWKVAVQSGSKCMKHRPDKEWAEKSRGGLKGPLLDNIQLYRVLKLGGGYTYISISGTTEGWGLLNKLIDSTRMILDMVTYVAVPSTQYFEMLSPLLLLSWQTLRSVLITKDSSCWYGVWE